MHVPEVPYKIYNAEPTVLFIKIAHRGNNRNIGKYQSFAPRQSSRQGYDKLSSFSNPRAEILIHFIGQKWNDCRTIFLYTNTIQNVCIPYLNIIIYK